MLIMLEYLVNIPTLTTTHAIHEDWSLTPRMEINSFNNFGGGAWDLGKVLDKVQWIIFNLLCIASLV
jgi:hypothetical protein